MEKPPATKKSVAKKAKIKKVEAISSRMLRHANKFAPIRKVGDKVNCRICELEILFPLRVCCICSSENDTSCEICGDAARWGMPPVDDKVTICSCMAHCTDHKKPGEVDLKSAHCKGKPGKDCYSQPTFCRKPGTKATHCGSCIDPDDRINWHSVKSVKCQDCDKTQASFGINGKVTHCGKCKTLGMRTAHLTRCMVPGCVKTPYYSVLGVIYPTYCADHKTDEMSNVVEDMCKSPMCKFQATFGKPGTKDLEFCSEHKDVGDVCLVGKRCEKCLDKAYFGFKIKTRCSIHRESGMTHLRKDTCDFTDNGKMCPVLASLGYTSDGVPRRCAKHKGKNMVNVTARRCGIDGCGTIAGYGPLFGRLIHCGRHAEKDEYINNHPKCIVCDNSAYYSSEIGKFPEYCCDHTKPGYVNVVERRCVTCGTEDRIPGDQVDCYACRGFKDDNVRHKKEYAVKALLDHHGVKYTQHDKRVSEGCSRYRPDFVVDCGTFYLIVECDENQHAGYAPECEKNRMLQLYQDFGMSVQFIRYNPDNYKDVEGKKVVMKGNREDLLIDAIRNVMMWETPEFSVGAIYICYDRFDGKPKNVNLDYDGYMKSLGKVNPEP